MLYVFFQHFVCVCVLYESKSGCWWTLTVSVMVIVCQSLGGAAQQAKACVYVCVCAFVCICVHAHVCLCTHISRKG